uniref:DUF5753 domain-containing protein n=1 Tax=Parastrongyloides trichosuri TaxID=131310 RepID=A0A0N4Z8J1_PARTI
MVGGQVGGTRREQVCRRYRRHNGPRPGAGRLRLQREPRPQSVPDRGRQRPDPAVERGLGRDDQVAEGVDQCGPERARASRRRADRPGGGLGGPTLGLCGVRGCQPQRLRPAVRSDRRDHRLAETGPERRPTGDRTGPRGRPCRRSSRRRTLFDPVHDGPGAGRGPEPGRGLFPGGRRPGRHGRATGPAAALLAQSRTGSGPPRRRLRGGGGLQAVRIHRPVAADGAAAPDRHAGIHLDPPLGSDPDHGSAAVYRQPWVELTGDKAKFLHKRIADRGEAR